MDIYVSGQKMTCPPPFVRATLTDRFYFREITRVCRAITVFVAFPTTLSAREDDNLQA